MNRVYLPGFNGGRNVTCCVGGPASGRTLTSAAARASHRFYDNAQEVYAHAEHFYADFLQVPQQRAGFGKINGSFALTETDSDSDSKPDSYIVLCRTFHRNPNLKSVSRNVNEP